MWQLISDWRKNESLLNYFQLDKRLSVTQIAQKQISDRQDEKQSTSYNVKLRINFL